ncbi:ParA family protein [Arachnia propionica]|uniref:ParA family protein n=1 Tax=Arachnia propionica TaxID=1750 RepID=A0A3P1WV58_9ACTN|nr:ParA family protein [Arachnia propionica]RRD50514.1 ParA family protein [Arachnia propionica]
MTIWTVALPKGGSAKTTTAAELVAHLTAQGRRVLAIDACQQGDLGTRLGITDDTEVTAVTAEVLIGTATITEAAIPSPAVPGADVLVGTRDLQHLHQHPEVLTALRDILPTLTDWDDVVIDTPPAIDLATLAALAAADQIIVPVVAAGEAFDQIDELAEVIQSRIAPRIRPEQHIGWIIPTQQRVGRCLDADVLAQLHRHWPGRVTPPVREAVAARESYLAGLPLGIYAPDSNIAADYRAALEHITQQEVR